MIKQSNVRNINLIVTRLFFENVTYVKGELVHLSHLKYQKHPYKRKVVVVPWLLYY